MRFVRFFYENRICYGKIEGLDNEITLLKENPMEILVTADKKIKSEEVKLLSPVVPKKIIAVGRNFPEHSKEVGGKPNMLFPALFVKLPHTVIGQHEAIIYPSASKRVDYEAELALIIGKDGYKIPEEKASDYIFGVTCLNDVTARDLQREDEQWTRAKNFPTFCPIGPCIATEIDYNDLAIQSYLNGELKQSGRVSQMTYSPDKLVSLISSVIPLEKGDIIATGTPEGIGPMNIGDIIEIKIEKIGTLRNIIKAE